MKPTNYQIFKYGQLGGLDTRTAPANMNPNMARDLLNVDLDQTGGVVKRSGYAQIASTATSIATATCIGLTQFRTSAGTLYQVSGWMTQALYKMDAFDGTWDVITGDAVLATSSNGYISFAIGADTLIGTDGINLPWKWTGAGNAATLTGLASIPMTKANYVTYYKSRTVFAGTTESSVLYANRIRWANASTIETYSLQDYTDGCEASDGASIVGMRKLLDDLYIFKDSLSGGIKRMYYTGSSATPFGITNIADVGTRSGDSIVEVDVPDIGNGLMYWGVDNKIRFFDGSTSTPISDHIQPTLDATNLARMPYVKAVNYPNLSQVWFFFSNGTSTTNNSVLVFDYLHKAFLFHDGISANAAALFNDSSYNTYLVTGNYGGKTFKHDTGTSDYGSNFNSYYATSWLDFGNSELTKRPRWINLYTNNDGAWNLCVNYDYDFNTASTATSGNALLSSRLHRLELQSSGKERYMSLKFSNNTKDQPYKLYRYEIIAKLGGVRDTV